MADVFSSKQRSEIMSKIRSSRTQGELIVKSFLEEAAIPFQYQPSIKGRPDFLIDSKIAVFVNGCFWHKCPVHYREPKSNVTFWRNKVQMNETRLQRNRRVMRREGFKVLSFWEHDVKRNSSKCLEKVRRTLRKPLSPIRARSSPIVRKVTCPSKSPVRSE